MEYNTRCKTCNRVSSKEIETDAFDQYNGKFIYDPVDDNAFICMECSEWHQELMLDFSYKDDPWGWEDSGEEEKLLLVLEELTTDINQTLEEEILYASEEDC